MKNRKGFTLVELLAVIAILAILVIIAMPNILNLFKTGKKNSFLVECKEIIKTAKQQWIQDSINSTSDRIYSKCNDGSCSVVLDMSGRQNIEYYVKINKGGEVVSVYITDGTYQYIEDNKEVINDIEGAETGELMDNIQEVSELSDSEKITIKDNVVTVNDNDVSSPVTNYSRYKCVRAKILHYETCLQTQNFYCKAAGFLPSGSQQTSVVTYGNLGTKGKLQTGDAFDCDVNGDGRFDAGTERFYYVSDYFDTMELEFDSNYATLIYYSNVSSGMPSNSMRAYDSTNDNFYGPRTAVNDLPTSSQWKNVSLKNTNRQLLSEYKGTHNSKKAGGKDLPIYSYSGRAARLIAAQEIMEGCNTPRIGDVKIGELDSCWFLFENTKFTTESNVTHGFWTETARTENTNDICVPKSYYRNWNLYRASNNTRDNSKFGVRPAIDVKKSDMEL